MREAEEHEYWMHQCIALGKLALEKSNPPVGAILVSGGNIISTAEEEAHTSGDVTDHAEMLVLRRALHLLNKTSRKEMILYTTHEPCVLCAYAIRHYHIGTIVFGCQVPYVGGYSSKYNLLNERDHPSWGNPPVIIEGILADECKALTAVYIQQKNNYR
jgi:tRNA(adenine34) deaminase